MQSPINFLVRDHRCLTAVGESLNTMAFSLVLLNGPTPGAMLRLDANQEPVTIGRDASCSLPIDDHQCSRLHARVWADNGRWIIEDCRSRNGTQLNYQPIERSALEPGDLIRLGERLIVFVEESSAAESARSSAISLASSAPSLISSASSTCWGRSRS